MQPLVLVQFIPKQMKSGNTTSSNRIEDPPVQRFYKLLGNQKKPLIKMIGRKKTIKVFRIAVNSNEHRTTQKKQPSKSKKVKLIRELDLMVYVNR